MKNLNCGKVFAFLAAMASRSSLLTTRAFDLRRRSSSYNNQNPHVFVWTASVERILTKIAKSKEALVTLH